MLTCSFQESIPNR